MLVGGHMDVFPTGPWGILAGDHRLPGVRSEDSGRSRCNRPPVPDIQSEAVAWRVPASPQAIEPCAAQDAAHRAAPNAQTPTDLMVRLATLDDPLLTFAVEGVWSAVRA